MSQPIVWTIAGSDSGSGAGIQADLKTFNALGVFGASVITAITAQNTLGVDKIEAVSAEMIKAQLKALRADLPPVVIKLGMLHSPRCIEVVVDILKDLDAFVICDPVMIATSGDALFESNFMDALKKHLLPLVDLLTPNLEEVLRLIGLEINKEANSSYVVDLANELLKLGSKAVLIKGGHVVSNVMLFSEFAVDFWTDGKESAWLRSKRQNTHNTHGTGCTLASAIAACIAQGYSQLDAIVIAKAYINQGLRLAPNLGKGHGPLAHLGWPENQNDLPYLFMGKDLEHNTQSISQEAVPLPSPHCIPPSSNALGFYPIVDSTEWLERLLPLGVKTIQLRIKEKSNSLENEISKAVQLANQYDCRLFINDHWELAIKYKAYGVHLGQEDLDLVDLRAIAKAGINLGVSTHSYSEVARILPLHPAYIAIGPIFATSTKDVAAKPQGIETLKRWRRTLHYPLVAIGGITLQNAQEVLNTGVDGIAVISDITKAPDWQTQTKEWLKLFA